MAFTFVVDGCAKSDPAAVCAVMAPTECPAPAPRYRDVATIVEQRCATPCHSGVPDGPWPLIDYEHVADWADVVRASLLDCSMPPADGGVSITTNERLTILAWIRCGFPE